MLAAFVAGCGSGQFATYEVTGRVAFPDGKPLDRGWIEFETVEQNPSLTARAEIQPDGSFSLGTYEPDDGAVEGRHRVAVIVPLPEGAGDNPRLIRQPIDPRFNSFETSGLEFTVRPDASQNDFQVTVTAPSG